MLKVTIDDQYFSIHNLVLYLVHMNAHTTINLIEDLCPLSEFRADTAAFITKMRANQRPLALTQHGKCTAVVVSSESYQAMVEQLSLLEDISMGESDILAGRVISHEDLKKKVMARFKK